MPGLVPGIHAKWQRRGVDGRDKRGQDYRLASVGFAACRKKPDDTDQLVRLALVIMREPVSWSIGIV